MDSRELNAPYNQPIPEKIKVSVCISNTLHKTVEVEVEEGYDDYMLKQAVYEQIFTPFELLEDKGWIEDELEIIEE